MYGRHSLIVLGILTGNSIMLCCIKFPTQDTTKRFIQTVFRRWTGSSAVRGKFPARYELPGWTRAGLKLAVIEC